MERPAKRLATEETRASVLSDLACRVPVELMVDHAGMQPLDLLCYLIAFNPTRLFIVIEALAGCGKTSMLTGLVKRLPTAQSVLLLSFTRSAVRVADTRLRADNVRIQTQTFDSIFYHSVRSCMGIEAETFQQYRDLSRLLDVFVLTSFSCRARSSYHLRDIDYVLVDEAQDTPEEAVHFLDLLRRMGKTVVIVGDRRQAIYGFQGTQNLFDLIPTNQKVTQTMRISRRCRWYVAAYINRRFGTDMVSIDGPAAAPAQIRLVVVQARCNRTLGRLYAQMLFTFLVPCAYDVADGDSTASFREALFQEVATRYRLTREEAEDVVAEREQLLRPQVDDECSLTFSTVHRYKGDEGCVTVLADDIAIEETGRTREEECVKYVAGTRASWGIIDMNSLKFHGHPKAKRLLYRLLVAARQQVGINAVSRMSSSPPCLLLASLSPTLSLAIPRSLAVEAGVWDRREATVEGPTNISGVPDTLLLWDLEARAREGGCAVHATGVMHLTAHPFHDRNYHKAVVDGVVTYPLHIRVRTQLVSLKWRALVGRVAVTRRAWGVTQDESVAGAMAASTVRLFAVTKNITLLKAETTGAAVCRAVQRVFAREIGNQGALQDSSKWRLLVIRQVVGTGPFAVRAHADVVVVDDGGRGTLILPTFSRRPLFGQYIKLCWTVEAMAMNTGLELQHAAVYNGVLNTWHEVETGHIRGCADPAEEINQAVGLRMDAKYYGRLISVESVTAIVDE